MQRWDQAPGLSYVVIKTPLSCFHITYRPRSCAHSPCMRDLGQLAADWQQKGWVSWFGPSTLAVQGARHFAASLECFPSLFGRELLAAGALVEPGRVEACLCCVSQDAFAHFCSRSADLSIKINHICSLQDKENGQTGRLL